MENYCLAKGQEDADARAEKINALHRTIKDRKQVRSTHFESEMEYLQEIADDTVENDEKSHIQKNIDYVNKNDTPFKF